MGVDLMFGEGNRKISRRQTAIRLLAQELSDSTLLRQGSGEFDPAFVITKLGAKVNRILATGLLERIEQRDTTAGPMWNGRLRDTSGLFFFTIGNFQSEELHLVAEEISALHETGEPILLLIVGKSSLRTTEDGGIFTGIRPEEIIVIDKQIYTKLLLDSVDATMRRIHYHNESMSLDPTEISYTKAGIPDDLREGLLIAREHYDDVDSEVYALSVMRALDVADGGDNTSQSNGIPISSSKEDIKSKKAVNNEKTYSPEEINEIIADIIEKRDQGQGVEYDTIMSNCEARGFERGPVEEVLDQMCEKEILIEEQFGWYKKAS